MFLIIGLGNQGSKRFKVLNKLGKVFTVDPQNPSADYKNIFEVDFNEIQYCFICVPEMYKEDILDHCIDKNKHIFVEKPVLVNDAKFKKYREAQILNKKNFKVGYSLNYESHIIEWKKYFKKNLLGSHYYSNLIYGNGTALNVKKAEWRDKGSGVFQDLGVHIIELILALCDNQEIRYNKIVTKNFENKSFDYCRFVLTEPHNFHCEVSYLEWENLFSIHSVFEKGIVKLSGLNKWGQSSITVLERVSPSGKPKVQVQKTFDNSGAFEQETVSVLSTGRLPDILDIDKTIEANNIMAKMLSGTNPSKS